MVVPSDAVWIRTILCKTWKGRGDQCQNVHLLQRESNFRETFPWRFVKNLAKITWKLLFYYCNILQNSDTETKLSLGSQHPVLIPRTVCRFRFICEIIKTRSGFRYNKDYLIYLPVTYYRWRLEVFKMFWPLPPRISNVFRERRLKFLHNICI